MVDPIPNGLRTSGLEMIAQTYQVWEEQIAFLARVKLVAARSEFSSMRPTSASSARLYAKSNLGTEALERIVTHHGLGSVCLKYGKYGEIVYCFEPSNAQLYRGCGPFLLSIVQ